jgi:peptidoglycan-N-acetylglucosamine deacetylase
MSAFPTVALTYDDGPSEWTRHLLDVLAERDAHATFFVLGSHIEGHEKILRRAVKDGHELGLHGWNHKPVADLTPGALIAQLEMTELAITDAAGVTPKWWRPPWNRADSSAVVAATDCGFAWCGVTLDGKDVTRSEEQIVTHVLRELAEGAIIGLHDGIAPNGEQQVLHRDYTVRATARILEHCRSVTVSELLA